MKKTALYEKHVALSAKMVPFAGYLMPVSYAGIKAEHQAVREAAGVFDVSHMGEFLLEGENALALIQQLCSNDAAKLYDGKVQYTCMPNESGGIVDDLLVYRMAEHSYMLVVNASNIQKDWNWISRHNDKGVSLTDISERTTLLAIQGPKAGNILQSLTDLDLAMEYYTFQKGMLAGIPDVIISATGYTGAGGFELYFPNEQAGVLWGAIFKAGEPYGIQAAGLGARDTLRLEMGYCLYGNDIVETTSPLEAGLGWICRFSKAFTHSAALLQQKQQGLRRRLVGFEMIERGIPRHDQVILNGEGQAIGSVTSGTQSPSLGKAIGMGYVGPAYADPGSVVFIDIRGQVTAARVVPLPFYQA